MQSLNDDEQRLVLGEVLADKLDAILEYVKDIPDMKERIGKLENTIEKTSNRLDTDEAILKAHEIDIRTINSHLSIA